MLFLAKIDVFGTPASLNIFGNPKKKSKFGGLCTLLFLGFVVWATYNGARKLFVREVPTVVSNTLSKETPRALNFSSESFPMAFIVQLPLALGSGGFYNASIYNLEVQMDMLERVPLPNGTVQKKWTYTKLKTEPCTKEYFGVYAPSFTTFTFKGSYCIVKNQPAMQDLELTGMPGSLLFKSLRVQVSACNPSKTNTTGVTCGTQAEINKYLGGSLISVLFMNNVMQLQNYSYPTAKFRDTYSSMMSPVIYKETTFDIGYVEVTTDAGWIVDTTDIQNSLQVNRVTENFDPIAHDDKVIMACLFQSSRIEDYYSRTYIKIPAILAEIGGIANAVLAVLLILITPYLKFKSSEALMYELFEVKKDGKPGNNKKYKAKKSMVVKNNNTNPAKKQYMDAKAHPSEQQLLSAMSPKSFLSEAVAFKSTPNESQHHQGIELALQSPQATPRKPNSLKDSNILGISPTPRTLEKQNTSFSEDGQLPYENEQEPTPARGLKESKKILGLAKSESYQRINDTPTRDLQESKKNLSVAKADSYQRIKSTTKSEEALAAKKLETDQEQKMSSLVKINVNVEANENHEIKEKAKEIGKINLHGEAAEKKDSSETEEEGKKAKAEWDLEKGKDDIKEEAEEVEEVEEDSAKKKNKKDTNPLQAWEYALSLIYTPKSLRPKVELIEEGVKIVEERLDINYILQKLSDLEKLVSLILDQDQIHLFQCMPKPYLQIKLKRQSQMGKMTRTKSFREEIDQELALQAYQTIKNKVNKNAVDVKLIEACSQNFA